MSRAPQRSDRALILRRTPFGESSLVVQVLTPEHGRVHLIAKGAYRANSGYCGALDLFDTLQLEWTRPSAGLGTLSGARVLVRRRALSRSLPHYRAALAALELAELAAQESREERALFELVEGALDAGCAPRVDPELARIAFELRFLGVLGLAPALRRCASCGKAPRGASAQDVDFALRLGGRLCAECAAQARAGGERTSSIAPRTLAAAAALAEAEAGTLAQLRLSAEERQRVRAVVEAFVDYHLEQRPRSRRAQHRASAPGARPATPP